MKLESAIGRLESGESLKISALGDSLTYGWMVRKGYIDFFEEMLAAKYRGGNFSIDNRGIPGNTAEDGIHRLRRDVLDSIPNLVLVQFALNDMYMGCSAERFKINIQTIVDSIRNDLDTEILLMTSVFINDEKENRMADEFYNKLEEISEKEAIPLARVHEYWKKKVREGTDHGSLVQMDQVHPTVEGYRLMAEAVMEVF
ncbi:MAG: hypothetical protein GY754_29510 [bacterium]|nr:hypothetical protein [bacterium]